MKDRICVCGAGTMGAGIALLCAKNGFDTLIYDLHPDWLEKGKVRIDKELALLLERKKINIAERAEILKRLQFSSDISECGAGVIIEAIVEEAAAKKGLFIRLAEVNTKESLFATNTSSLSVTSLSETIPHPERFMGMHFFNPATVMPLVELIRTPKTSEEVSIKFRQLALQLGKKPVLCRDLPGFIVNRVARSYYLEALRLAETGTVSFETIDQIMESAGFRLGPFRLMDLIGNDTNYAVSCSVYEAMGRPPRLEPSGLQKEMTLNNELGKKTGKGYYLYP